MESDLFFPVTPLSTNTSSCLLLVAEWVFDGVFLFPQFTDIGTFETMVGQVLQLPQARSLPVGKPLSPSLSTNKPNETRSLMWVNKGVLPLWRQRFLMLLDSFLQRPSFSWPSTSLPRGTPPLLCPVGAKDPLALIIFESVIPLWFNIPDTKDCGCSLPKRLSFCIL